MPGRNDGNVLRWAGTNSLSRTAQNLGRVKNIKAVLGPDPLLWCWPTVPPGDGLSFEIIKGKLRVCTATPSVSCILIHADGEYTGQWPPEDPATRKEEDHVFTLQKDPWTYGNGSFNPGLHPGSSNSGFRERPGSLTSRQRYAYNHPSDGGEVDGTHAAPPYHPDYDESRPSLEHFSQPPYAEEGKDEDDRYDEDGPQRRRFIRRGSEGYEVRPIDREDMLRRYVDPQPHLTAFARAQERADRGEVGDNYGLSEEEDRKSVV